MSFGFEVLKTDPSGARLGRLTTAHGVIETPAFMPVGTAASVKGMTQQALEELGVGLLLSNTYHLYLRPGHELIARMGGLHRFMSWPGAILTDSGGFQIFSLADLRKVTDEGVRFRSHLDGSEHFLTPEKAVEMQRALGSDIAMVLDECIEYPAEPRTRRERRRAHGGLGAPLPRRRSMPVRRRRARRRKSSSPSCRAAATRICGAKTRSSSWSSDFPGYAVGGLAVGEPHELTCEMAAAAASCLPAEKPRYMMGVGKPAQLADYVRCGIDMMDCVLPTRNARNGCLYTRQGELHIKNAQYANDPRPIDESCGCMVCRRYSRAYLCHLFRANEILASILNTHHNLFFFLDLMRAIREAIAFGNLSRFSSEFQARLEAGPS